MSELIVFFIASLGIGALLATIAIWAPRRPQVRVAALAATLLFIPVVYVQLVELLSRPKPMTFEWFERDVQLAQILGSSLDEGNAIYLWLRLEGEIAPRYYVMPWRQQAAEKLEDMIDNAIRQNATIVLKKPFIRKSDEEWGDLNAYVVPPPLPPQKKPPAPPQIFNPRRQDI